MDNDLSLYQYIFFLIPVIFIKKILNTGLPNASIGFLENKFLIYGTVKSFLDCAFFRLESKGCCSRHDDAFRGRPPNFVLGIDFAALSISNSFKITRIAKTCLHNQPVI